MGVTRQKNYRSEWKILPSGKQPQSLAKFPYFDITEFFHMVLHSFLFVFKLRKYDSLNSKDVNRSQYYVNIISVCATIDEIIISPALLINIAVVTLYNSVWLPSFLMAIISGFSAALCLSYDLDSGSISRKNSPDFDENVNLEIYFSVTYGVS